MNILDKRFRYVPAAQTDIRKTFERVKAEQKALAEERLKKVIDVKRGKR